MKKNITYKSVVKSYFRTNLYLHVIYLIILISFLPFSANAQPSAIDNGVTWLLANQTLSGRWGDPTLTEFRDSTIVASVLKELKKTRSEYTYAVNYINSITTSNNDYLARKTKVLAQAGKDVSPLINTLLSSQNPEEYDDTLYNYPEGGWGNKQGYATNNLDTSLALDALNSAGLAGGLSVSNESIGPGETDEYQFELPEGATSLTILITSLTGEIDFRIKPGSPPTLYDPYYHLTFAPVNLSGLPVVPGTNYIRIDSSMSSTYSFEVSYVANGFDTKSLLTPINYLIAAQNADGGWGIGKGSDSDIYITSKVLITLEEYAAYFDLDTPITNGVTWLKGQQNVDNGFGVEGSSVYITALAYIAIANVDLSSTEAQNALDYLIGSQQGNGSWNDKAYDTAVSIWAIWTSIVKIDTDEDGMPDFWENQYGLDPSDPVDAGEDSDIDGLNNLDEFNQGTVPINTDTDGDGLNDADELASGRNPLLPEIAKEMKQGINLFSYPLQFQPGLTSEQLPGILGIESFIQEISRLDSATGLFETTDFSLGIPTGTIFPIVSGEGYLIKMYDKVLGLSSGDFLTPFSINLYQGINFVGFTSPPTNLTACDLMRDIGDETEISSIQAYEKETDSFQNVHYYGGKPVGPDFQIRAGDAYFIYMKVGKLGWGPPNNPPVADAGTDQIATLSTLITLDGTGSYDPDAGPDPLTYKWTQIKGSPVILLDDTDVQPTFTAPAGIDTLEFTLSVDDGKGDSTDSVTVTVGTPPDIEIISPSDGETIYSSPVTVTGTIDDDSATVTVNDIPATVTDGIFSADVPLIEGENTITATAVNTMGLSDTDTIKVTLSTVDYTLPQGGSVNDSRVFSEDAALVGQVVSYSETHIEVPAFITYTTTGVYVFYPTDIQIDFNIAASPTATLGIHTFQIQYDFYDTDGTNLFSHTFDFKVQII